MTLVGIVRNPRSRRNRGRPAVDPARLGGRAILREPATLAELEDVCREFADRDVALIAIDGGDGTVRDVLSAARSAFRELPPVAFLASGKTNILAGNSGSWGTGERALERLVEAAGADLAGRRRHRLASMSVSFANRRLTGFVLGTGAFRRAVALADHGVADPIGLGPARVAAGIGRGVLSLGRRADRRQWLAGTPMRVSIDRHGPDRAHPRLIFMATTLRRFTLGVWPFWNHDGHPLRYLDIAAPPPRLAAALLPALRGRPKPWMAQAGYRSGSANRLAIRLGEAFVLDGEAYAPGPDGLVTIEAGPVVEFVAP